MKVMEFEIMNLAQGSKLYPNCLVATTECGRKFVLPDNGDYTLCHAELRELSSTGLTPVAEDTPQSMPVALLNFSAFTPRNGTISQREASFDECKTLIKENGFVSAIGHQATAEALSEMFGVDCPVSRVDFEQQIGQTAIVFRLRARQPEGAILDRATIEQIGYDLLIMERTK